MSKVAALVYIFLVLFPIVGLCTLFWKVRDRLGKCSHPDYPTECWHYHTWGPFGWWTTHRESG